MKPINKAERNSAFINFLLVFLLTIATILAVVFFSIRVPELQNEKLRDRIALMEQEKMFAERYSQAMRATLEEMGKFNADNIPASVTRLSVQNKLIEMERLASENPNPGNSLFDDIYQQLSDLYEAKAKLKRLEDQQGYLQQ